MPATIGEILLNHRKTNRVTQEQLAARYGITGPAVFKFEKGFVTPSLKLWLRIATDLGLPEEEAVLIWAQAKLPEPYKEAIALKAGSKSAKKGTDFGRITDRNVLRETALADSSLPAGLRAFIKDDEYWAIYKPSGREISLLREFYGSLADKKKDAWREALRVLRDFSGREA